MESIQEEETSTQFFTKLVEHPNGSTSRAHVSVVNGHWQLTSEASSFETRLLEAVDIVALADALDMVPGLLDVGSEVTRVDCLGIDLHELLGRLEWIGAVDGSDAPIELPDDIYSIQELISNGRLALASNLTLIPSAIKLNDLHLVALFDGERTGFAVYHEDASEVVVTRPVAYESWVTVRPGCEFSGASDWGYSGPLFWTCLETGDQYSGPPEISSAPSEDQLVQHVVSMICSEDIYAPQFIIGQIGLPDARPEQDIHPNFHLEGGSFSVYLPDSDCEWILNNLLEGASEAELAEGLRDQSTPFGKVLYSWAAACCRGVADVSDFTVDVLGGYQTKTWEEVHGSSDSGANANFTSTNATSGATQTTVAYPARPDPLADYTGSVIDPNLINPFTKQPYKFD
jgi:hypothetical protein